MKASNTSGLELRRLIVIERSTYDADMELEELAQPSSSLLFKSVVSQCYDEFIESLWRTYRCHGIPPHLPRST